MKKLLTLGMALLCGVSLSAGIAALPDTASAEESATTGSISVDMGAEYDRKDERQDHLEIPLTFTNCSFDAKALGNTQTVTNQFDKISLYATVGEANTTNYEWYTLAELNAMKNDAGMPYVVRTAQHGSTLFIAMDCFWNGAKDLLPEDVKAVKLEAGMTVAYYSEDHWSWDGGDTLPNSYGESVECTTEDLILERVPSTDSKKNDVYRPIKAGEGDTIEFELDSWHYDVGATLSVENVVSATAKANGYGGVQIPVAPSDLTFSYDFTTANIASPVTVTSNGATGTTEVYVADIKGELIVKTGADVVGRKDGRQDHLEINFDIVTEDPADLWECKALGTTQTVTNQFDKISLYASVGVGNTSEYKWYTLAELNAMKNNAGMPYVVRTAQHGTTLFIAMDCYWGGNKDFMPANVKAVLIEKGFVFATYPKDHWSWNGGDTVPETYGVATQAPLMNDVLLELDHIHTEGGAANDSYNYYTLSEGDTLKVLSQPTKTEYEVNETFDATGAKLQAVYNSLGGRTFEVDGKNVEYAYDFSEIGVKTVTGNYGGQTFSFEVEVANTIESIEVKTMPTKAVYDLAETPDYSGLIVTVNTTTGAYDVEATDVAFSSFDTLTAGKKTVTVTYKGATCAFDVTVEDQDPDAYIDFYTGSPTTFTDQFGCLAVRFAFSGIEFFNNTAKALYRVDNGNNVKDHVRFQIADTYQGGKLTVGEWYTVGELMATTDARGTKYIERVSQFGETLLFHLDTYMGDAPTNEFIIDHVAAIKIDAGFYFVDYYDNTWGNNEIMDYWILDNAILRNDLYIQMNTLGIAWVRPFAEEAGMTIKSMPTKTVYELEDKLDTTGLVLHCKYADGFEEDIVVDEKNCKYDFSEIGTAMVTVSYNEKKITFDVEVVEELPEEIDSVDSAYSADSSDSASSGEQQTTTLLSGCFGSVGSSCTAVVALAGAAVIVFKKRKQE